MSNDEAAVSFVVDYEMSVDDLREQDIVGRLAAWRTKPLWAKLAFPVFSLALLAVTVLNNRTVGGCFILQPTPPQALNQPGAWQCVPTSIPNDLLGQNAWLGQYGWPFAVVGAALAIALNELVGAWARPPRWWYRLSVKRDELPGRYRYEIAADGITVARPDGAIAFVPWPVFTAVRETREWILLCGRGYGWGWILPKRALADQSSVQQLGEFLRASVGREPPPA